MDWAKKLQQKLDEEAEKRGTPGVAVGIYHEGAETYANYGVTSIENPLPVNRNTLFQSGSTGKTFTATALMRLVEQGLIDLDERVRTYVPELRLKDEDVAGNVRVINLMNHTAGWSGELYDDTGHGDDALEKYVARMAGLPQDFPLGLTASYNNASFSLAGRIIEKVTGKTYEDALKEMIFEPLGMDHSFYDSADVMTHRFAIGHRRNEEDVTEVTRPYRDARGMNPAGGASQNAADLITWARFHLGDGRSATGERILKPETLDLMKQPTVDISGSGLADHVGICWMLHDYRGVRIVGHGGNTTGHSSAFTTVPERDFAITVLTNCSTTGGVLKLELRRWALEQIGVAKEPDPEPISLDNTALGPFVGDYETHATALHVAAGNGGLDLEVTVKPEQVLALFPDGNVPKQPPVVIRFLSGTTDRFVYTFEGHDVPPQPGYFARDANGDVVGIHLGGRLAMRVPAKVPAAR
jgi:CubicO group peptidase (beta-lactamase class C family)